MNGKQRRPESIDEAFDEADDGGRGDKGHFEIELRDLV